MKPAKFAILPIALTLMAVALTGCSSASVESTAEKCGGEDAGITVTDDMLEYDESADAAGSSWTCILEEMVPDSTDQYTITQGLDGAGARDGEFNGWTVVYGLNASRGVQLSLWRS